MHMQAYMNLYIYTYICVYIYFLFPKKDSILYICFIFCYQIIYLDSLEKDPDARKDWRQKEKGAVEDKVVGECHWFNGHAAAAAASLQLCPTLRPHRRQPTRLPLPGILQARTLEWAATSFSNAWKWKVKVKSLSRVPPSATPWTAAFQAPPSMGFSRQEYWSGVPSKGMNVSKLQERVEDRGVWGATIHGVAESDRTWWPNNNNEIYLEIFPH